MQLTRALHRAIQLNPERIATNFRGRVRSYRDLGERVARLAAALRWLGLERDGRVAILALNSDRYQEATYACWWAGAVLNPVNIRWSAAEIAYSLDDCDCGILLIDDQHLPLLERLMVSVRRPPLLVHIGDGPTPEGMHSVERLIEQAAPMPDCNAGGEDLAVIMYTGGTTGRPKGVMLSHCNLWAGMVLRMADLAPPQDLVALNVAPLFHIAGLSAVCGRVMGAATNVYMPGFEAVEFMQTVARERTNETLLVPTMLQMVLDHPRFAEFDLTSLRRIFYGAAPISSALLERALEALPGAGLVNVYGMTETAGQISLNHPEAHGPEGRASGRYRSAGRATIGLQVRVVDSEGNELTRGQVGEVEVSGPSLMLGYWNRPEDTAGALHDGWLRTGDAARMDEEGYLYIVDRVKDMIISGGENVYSAEVENVLAQHPAVAQCAVIGIPDERWGETVHAVVSLKPGAQVSGEELQNHCRGAIAGYKCPRSVEFLAELPLSAAGKILKRELRESYLRR